MRRGAAPRRRFSWPRLSLVFQSHRQWPAKRGTCTLRSYANLRWPRPELHALRKQRKKGKRGRESSPLADKARDMHIAELRELKAPRAPRAPLAQAPPPDKKWQKLHKNSSPAYPWFWTKSARAAPHSTHSRPRRASVRAEQTRITRPPGFEGHWEAEIDLLGNVYLFCFVKARFCF